MKKRSSPYKKIIIACFWLLLWQMVAAAVASPLLLPGPLDTVKGLFRLVGDADYYYDIAATIGRCVAAIILAMIFGGALSLASYRYKLIRDILSVPVAFFKSVPIMAVAIYLIFLLASGNVPVVVCFIMCFPIVYTNLLTGLDSMDHKYVEMASVYKLPGSKIIRYIYWPQMYPYFKSAMSLIAGMSWKAVVTAEVLSIPKFSLGYELMNAKYYLNTDILFAYVTTIVIISVVFEKLVKFILNRFDVKPYEGSKIYREVLGSYGQTENDGMPEACAHASDDAYTGVPPKIVFTGIDKAFDGKSVLNDLTETFDAGVTTAVMAPSGVGKTTMMRILLGLETADSGSVTIDPQNASIGVLLQEDRLLPWLNVYDNLALILDRQNDTRVAHMLEAVGLLNDIYKLPGQLSGGMKHRVALARMFLTGSDLYVVDEPFRGLDEDTRNEVIEKLWDPEVKGRTAIVITHDPDVAEALAERIVYM